MRRSAPPSIECLEPRLCLGSMNAFAPEPPPLDEPLQTAVIETMHADALLEPARLAGARAADGVARDPLPSTGPAAPPTAPEPFTTRAPVPNSPANSRPGPPIVATPLPVALAGSPFVEEPVEQSPAEAPAPHRHRAPEAESLPAASGGSVSAAPDAGGSNGPSTDGPADHSAGISSASAAAAGGGASSSAGNSNANPTFGAPIPSQAPEAPVVAWFNSQEEPVVVRYDFRDQGEAANQITPAQTERATEALQAWSVATGGKVQFVQDTAAPASQIINIGTGDLNAFGFRSETGGLLGVGGAAVNPAVTFVRDASATGAATTSQPSQAGDASLPLAQIEVSTEDVSTGGLIDGGTVAGSRTGGPVLTGAIWLDANESWDTTRDNGNPAGTFDYFTVVAHETGHVLGYADSFVPGSIDMMNGDYLGERSKATIDWAVQHQSATMPPLSADPEGGSFDVHSMSANFPQLGQSEVQALLEKASMATASEDAIIAVVDRSGHILGVRAEQGVLDAIPDIDTRVFAIDGAIAEARTAAFFSNGDPTNIDNFSPNGTLAPLTSRTVRFISQSTITQREVESNPNIPDADSPIRGPGFVGPIGLGGHFPPEVQHTPQVDLFAIEHTNRDSLLAPGPDGIKGTADDFTLRGRFNIDPAFVPAGQTLDAPESYGVVSGLLPTAQSRGIGTLPGGIPLYRDTNGDGVGDTLIGGIGVFFPGTDGYATHEQGFVAGIGQTEAERTNAPRALEAEYIAFVAAGGSSLAQAQGANGAKSRAAFGSSELSTLDVPFGRIDLVGIQLEIIGPTAGIVGVQELLAFGLGLGTGSNSGADQPLQGGMLYNDGQAVPSGWLVMPHDSTVDNLTAADVIRQVNDGIAAAQRVRSAIRLNADGVGGAARSRMVFAVTDTSGEVLGLFRMQDSTYFSIDVAVAKARNTAYYADPAMLQPIDAVPGVGAGVAFSNRTFRFLSEPRFPSGVDGTTPPAFSILNDPGINPLTGENLGAPAPASAYQTVLGHDAFVPMTNFRDPGDASVVAIPGPGANTSTANQNGIVFFPGSTPIYRGPVLIGGLGISGDGVDQDDVVTFLAAQDYLANGTNAVRADQVRVNDVRLPYIKFLRNPFK